MSVPEAILERFSREPLVVQCGRRVGLCDVEVSQGGRLVAKGSFTYLFFER